MRARLSQVFANVHSNIIYLCISLSWNFKEEIQACFRPYHTWNWSKFASNLAEFWLFLALCFCHFLRVLRLAGISSSPYGTLPAAPQIGQQTGIPELRTGLSSRPPSYLSQRAVSLLSAKPVTPRPIAQQIRASASRARMRRYFLNPQS